MDQITAVVPEGQRHFRLRETTEAIDNTLNAELSYEAPNAEYTDAYQEGRWDGIVRLYDKRNSRAPKGLIHRVRDVLNDLGFGLEVEIDGDRSGDPVELDWDFEHDLRQYQNEATDEVIKNQGGIVSLPTGTGKTVTALNLLFKTQTQPGRAIVLVHTQELLYQWADEIRDILGVEPGLIGDGNASEGPVTVAVMQTLISRGPGNVLHENYGTAIYDECHRTSAADTMHQIGMDIDVKYDVGLSATPWRRVEGEELKIEGIVGEEVYEVSAPKMIEQGYLAEPKFDIIEYTPDNTITHGTDYHEAYRHAIVYDVNRNRAVVNETAELAVTGHKILINVDRVAHGRVLEYALNDDIEPGDMSDLTDDMDQQERFHLIQAVDRLPVRGLGAEFIHGGSSTDERQDVLDRFENGELDIVISTLLKEGVNIPNCSALIQAAAGKSDISQIQTIGRALRPQNGDSARIVDFADDQMYFEKQFETRMSVLARYYEEYGPDMSDITWRTKEGRVSLTDSEPTYDDIFGE